MTRSPVPESTAENFWMETPSLNMVPDPPEPRMVTPSPEMSAEMTWTPVP